MSKHETIRPTMTLAAAAYTDQDTFDRERDKIFAHSWQYVGHAGRLTKPGDYFVADVAGESLIITRCSDGTLSALFNVCAHRAARIATGEGCKLRFSCPYHGWTYDSRGQLKHAPNADHVPGFQIEDYALTPCAVEELHGLIFVNLDSKCPSLADSAPGLADDIDSYIPNLSELKFAHRTEATLATNWKVAVENFSECYHCPLVHRPFYSGGGANQGGGVDPESYRVEDHGIWQKHRGDTFAGEDFAQSSNVSQDRSDEFAVWWLWPNFAMQTHPGSIVNVRQWIPIDVDHTYVFVDWFLPTSEPNAWEKQMFAEHAAGVFAEDIPIVEMVQQGLRSRGYRGGPLMADRDGTVLSEHAVAAIQSLWEEAMGRAGTGM